ncbi:unnamed protein product [Diamesa serratosioi]
MSGLSLSDVVAQLDNFAPTSLAEKWDNVGLLIEPFSKTNVKKIMLTNDLTESVMEESIKENVNLIVSYHPPIFSGLKRLTQSSWKERIVVKCIENKIALYSPHTAWDVVRSGVNDWLAQALPIETSEPVMPHFQNPNIGAGRICTIPQPIILSDVIKAIKSYTGLSNVQIGLAVNGSMDSEIKTFAVCAGSGNSVLKDLKNIDMILTGEMSHHEVLDFVHKNIHVITLNHSNSERGYLKDFRHILSGLLNNEAIEILIAKTDRDPLEVC